MKNYLIFHTFYCSKEVGIVHTNRRQMPRKYNFDTNYFNNIDNHQKAYWLGFIFAEGNIYKNTLAIKLHNDDKYVLDRFKNDLSSQHIVKKVKNKNAHVLKIHAKHIVNQMNNLGIYPNKSGIIEFPPNLNQEFYSSFILGYYDGDGWISKRNNSYLVGFCSASKNFINSLQKILKALDFGEGYCLEREFGGNRKNGYQLTYYGDAALALLNFIYSCNIPSITRKLDKFAEFKNISKFLRTKKTSNYKGVYLHKKSKNWIARIQYKEKRIFLGSYLTEYEAVLSYNDFILNHNLPKYKLHKIE
jgi:intein/homing endonuclease